MAGAIEEGLVHSDTVLDVPNSIRVDDKQFDDVESHAPKLSVADILRESSNVGAIKIAHLLGKERFDRYQRAFGFGSLSGVRFPGESPGILLPVNQYNNTSLYSIPIGNGIAVTALQMLDAYMTFANHGDARAPRLVRATVDSEGNEHPVPLVPTHRVVSEATAHLTSAPFIPMGWQSGSNSAVFFMPWMPATSEMRRGSPFSTVPPRTRAMTSG